MSENHDCLENLSPSPADKVVDSSTVHVYWNCSKCDNEFKTEYEFVEIIPLDDVGDENHDCMEHLTHPNDSEVIVSGGTVHVYDECKKCDTEFEAEYEFVETVPV